MKNYKNHYLPIMLSEFERERKEFESNRKPDDPAGKAFIAVKMLEKAENQIALLYMCDDMSERIERLEDQVIKLMTMLNDTQNDKGNHNNGTCQSAGDDR